MLSAGYKKEAMKEYKKAGAEYKRQYEGTIKNCEKLHKNKEKSVKILIELDEYIHSLSNKPKEIEKAVYEIKVKRRAFEKEIEDLKLESKKGERISQNVAGAGVLTGVGVATLGPTAAMGIATTFGTASTGTAIATLSGIAQTNAALAWLGGGTLAAGGSGIVGGEAFLALAGPVGWAIGGAALVGGGLLANSKNKKIAEKAEKQTKEIKNETSKISRINQKVGAEIVAIEPLIRGISSLLTQMIDLECRDYKLFSDSDKDSLMQLVNSAESLSKRIGVKID